MPCCQLVLSAAASSTTTPSWLHRLHTKGGLSFPPNLKIDDLLYGQQPHPPPAPPAAIPPPPPPSSSNQRADPQDPLPKRNPCPKPPRIPSRPNPSAINDSAPAQPPPISNVIAELFAVPSAQRPVRPLKPVRKQKRPRPRPDGDSSPPHHKDSTDRAKAKAKARKRKRAEKAADVEGERQSKTEVTVIDTSTDGWKAAKLIIRQGTIWRIRDSKISEVSEPQDNSKGKRRAGLTAKTHRDKEKGKDAGLLDNIPATNGDVMKEPDDAIQAPKRPICSEPVSEGKGAEMHHI